MTRGRRQLLRAKPSGGARLNVLQWFGLAGAPLAWVGMHVFGWGVSEGHCLRGGARFGIPARAVEIGLLAGGLAVWALATAAALTVFLATRTEELDPEPPGGRLHMLATASLAVNAVFFCMIAMTGISTAVEMGCRSS